MQPDYPCVITIIDEALIQCNFWICIYRRFICDDPLVSISYFCKLQHIVFALSTENDSRPAGWKITVRIIQPIPAEYNFCTVIFLTIYYEGPIHNKRRISMQVDLSAWLYSKCSSSVYLYSTYNNIRFSVSP